MSEQPPFEPWEERLQQIAGEFSYPPTPDIAGGVRAQLEARRPARRPGRLRLALLLLVALLAGSLAVPEVRAKLRALLRIGAVEVELLTPTPGVAPTRTLALTPAATLLDSLRLSGPTTLAEAQARLTFPVRLPAYPPELGPPDGIYLQELEGPALVLVWLDPQNPQRVALSLHALTSEMVARKKVSDQRHIAETRVNGEWALWLSGAHMLAYYDQSGSINWEMRRLVAGNVLIWNQGFLTYRLETDRSMEEAVKIAESLQDFQP